MDGALLPVLRDLVLVGGGHSHVAVLRRFGMRPVPGVRLTLVAQDVHTPYSGMLPGLVAGAYGFDEAHIDLGRLARFAGARLVHASARGLDLEGRRVLLEDRPALAWDVLSLNVGSTPTLRVPGALQHAVPVKPIGRFLERWRALLERVDRSPGPLRLGVVGGGAGGVELALAAQHALAERLRAAGHPLDDLRVELFSASAEILPTLAAGARARLARTLAARGVRVHAGSPVVAVAADRVRLADGTAVGTDELLWVTEASAAPWLAASGLEVDERGFPRVRATLESVSHPGVFAAGDVASVVPHPREKAGVFAVRQGRPLERNLRRALAGRRRVPYRPQTRFLTLIGTGDGRAVAARGSWSAEGAWVWRWKDRIDRRFMRTYSELEPMEPEPVRLAEGLDGDAERRIVERAGMRCAGCGSKVGARVLERVLARLEPAGRDDVVLGLEAPDDGALVRVPGGRLQVQTVDFFRALVDDPFVFGEIAANHCLGDVFAMGAEPQAALAIATLPYGPEAKVEAALEQLLAGANRALRAAGCALVGGHTSEGAELALGFSISGLVDPAHALRKDRLASGDRLVLTKALGTGTLFAADMRLRAKARWIVAATDSMRCSSGPAAEILSHFGARACTDVTGFGLLGHLGELLRASRVDAVLRLGALPLLEGARETAAAGLLSSLDPSNRTAERLLEDPVAAAGSPAFPLLFDPQTAGGLLAGVPAAAVEDCVAALVAAGYADAAVVGEVRPQQGPEPRVHASH